MHELHDGKVKTIRNYIFNVSVSESDFEIDCKLEKQNEGIHR
jgi:hypothetical protein